VLRELAAFHVNRPALAQEGANADFDTITTAVKAEPYEKALELAKAFVEKNDSSEDLARVLLEAGDVAEQKKMFEFAAGFFRLLVDKFPKSGHASAARAELVACYTFTRKLDACIVQAQANLELEPDSQWAEYWNFLIAQSYFRLWDYPQAKTGLEAFLTKYPNGKYAKDAQSCLDSRIPRDHGTSPQESRPPAASCCSKSSTRTRSAARSWMMRSYGSALPITGSRIPPTPLPHSECCCVIIHARNPPNRWPASFPPQAR